MTEITRDILKGSFKNGDRPNGDAFANLIDSFVNKASDGVTTDGDGNMVLARGLRLNNSNGTVAGGLRFASNQVQFFNGTTWVSLSSGGAGAFTPVGASPSVAFNGGNVGIGNFPALTPPTYRFEVNLGANTATTEQVRFGNVVCSNGFASQSAFGVFSHSAMATNANCALRQSNLGEVHLNAPLGQTITLRLGGSNVALGIVNGKTVIGGDAELTGPGAATSILQVSGTAFKSSAGGTWENGSDVRIKQNIRDLEVGLAELRQVRTVRYQYNGRAGTKKGDDGVGVLGQEIEKILPETVRRLPEGIPGDPGLEDLRIFDASALTFVLINAVKELAEKVDRLEEALALSSGDLARDRANPEPARQ